MGVWSGGMAWAERGGGTPGTPPRSCDAAAPAPAFTGTSPALFPDPPLEQIISHPTFQTRCTATASPWRPTASRSPSRRPAPPPTHLASRPPATRASCAAQPPSGQAHREYGAPLLASCSHACWPQICVLPPPWLPSASAVSKCWWECLARPQIGTQSTSQHRFHRSRTPRSPLRAGVPPARHAWKRGSPPSMAS